MPIINLQAKTIQEDQQIYSLEKATRTFYNQSFQVESTNRTVREIVDGEGRGRWKEKKEEAKRFEGVKKEEDVEIEYVDPNRGQIIDIVR